MANLTYPSDVLALPGLTSGFPDTPAPEILQGDALNYAHVAAACRQHQTRKLLAKTNQAIVTDDEPVASRRRKHVVTASNFDGPIPAWGLLMLTAIDQNKQQQVRDTNRIVDAIERMNQTLQQTNQTIAAMQQQMDRTDLHMGQMDQRMGQMDQRMGQMDQRMGQMDQRLDQRMERMERRMQQESERSMNRTRHKNSDVVEPLIRLSDGRNPTNAPGNLWFPGDQDDLTRAQEDQLDALLTFYGIQVVGDISQKRVHLKFFLGVNL